MTAPKPGDRVKAVLGESVLVGTLCEPNVVQTEDGLFHPINGWTVTVLSPAEPEWAEGGVVMDAGGRMFQRHGDEWWTGHRFVAHETPMRPLTLLGPIQAVLDLHSKHPMSGDCKHCNREYPCPTVRAARGIKEDSDG